MTAAITDIKILMGNQFFNMMSQPGEAFPLSEISQKIPNGYTLVPINLNRGTGDGNTIFLCYKRGENEAPITGLTVILGHYTSPPPGYTKIDVDLNNNAGGDWIFLCYTKEPGTPIVDIVFQVTGGNDQQSYAGNDNNYYSKIPVDLNKGAGGAYIYLYYLKKNVDETLNLTYGINPNWLNTPDKEYEVSRVQISDDKHLIRVQKLEYTLRTMGRNLPLDYTQEIITGTSKSETETFSVEVGISASASYGVFSAEVNTKFGYSRTSSFSAHEETKTTERINVEAKPYDRTFAFCRVIDVLRVINIPSGNVVSSLTTRTNTDGRFVTNEQGLWGGV
ncbi:MAG: hypothetical protein VKL60_19090 [Sphaerospermopsis sp.]|nr:hypothetical protein [Sphaerospermopsis sp.]